MKNIKNLPFQEKSSLQFAITYMKYNIMIWILGRQKSDLQVNQVLEFQS